MKRPHIAKRRLAQRIGELIREELANIPTVEPVPIRDEPNDMRPLHQRCKGGYRVVRKKLT